MMRSRVTLAMTLAAAMQAAVPSPPMTGRLGAVRPSTPETVGQDVARWAVQTGDRPAHPFDVGDVDADPVDLGGIDDHRVPGQRVAGDRAIQALARRFRELLRVVEIGERGDL